MINYISSTLDTFEKRKVSEVDLAILSWLSYLTLSDFGKLREDFRLKDIYCAEHFPHMFSTIRSKEESMTILAACVASPRFRDIRLSSYVEKQDDSTQFSAITYRLTEDTAFIAFRGTDTSFSGWKEDMNLSLLDPIPAQNMARIYINEVVGKLPANIYLGGHSKGGNLAVYAASECYRQEKIREIYSFDGPGFTQEDMKNSKFQAIRGKVIKVVPQASLVGMLFDTENDLKIVKSRSVSLGQHNMLNWEILDGVFQYRESLTAGAKLMYTTLNGFMNSLSYMEREKMINTIFEVFEETGESDFEVLANNIQEFLPVLVRKYFSLDKDTRKFMRKCLGKLAESSINSVPAMVLAEIGKEEERG